MEKVIKTKNLYLGFYFWVRKVFLIFVFPEVILFTYGIIGSIYIWDDVQTWAVVTIAIIDGILHYYGFYYLYDLKL